MREEVEHERDLNLQLGVSYPINVNQEADSAVRSQVADLMKENAMLSERSLHLDNSLKAVSSPPTYDIT